MVGWVSKISTWFWGLGKARRAGVLFVYILLLVASGSIIALSDKSQPADQANSGRVGAAQATLADVVEKRVDMQFGVDIPFQKKNVEDPALAKGESYIRTQGINGKRDVTYGVTYTNGVETAREILEEEIIKKPVDEITVVGTKVTEGNGEQVQGTQTEKNTASPASPEPTPSTDTEPEQTAYSPIKKITWDGGKHYYCIPPERLYYHYLNDFTAYNTMKDCLNSGGKQAT